MSDHDAVHPATDAELRARLQAFAADVEARVDTEAALHRLPQRPHPPTVRLLALAACVLAVVALAAALNAERRSVETSGLSDSPTQTTDCPSTTQPRAITQGAHMNKRFATTIVGAATAVALFGACGDDGGSAGDGATTIAKGEDIELVGSGEGLNSQTLNIDAVEQDGKVSGEYRVTDNVVTIQCADTETDGVVILGGKGTAGPDVRDGDLQALVIREGDPDSVALVANDAGATSCAELVASIPDSMFAEDALFDELEAGSDIET
jgi:hypothetical protein